MKCYYAPYWWKICIIPHADMTTMQNKKPSYRSINAFSQWANICWMLGLSQGSDRRMGAEEVCKTKLSFCTVYRSNTSHNLTADHLAVWWRHLWLFYIHTYKHFLHPFYAISYDCSIFIHILKQLSPSLFMRSAAALTENYHEMQTDMIWCLFCIS